MAAKVISNLTAVRGDTIISPQWLITNQVLPAGITKAELDLGLSEGVYTLVDLSRYSMRGMMRPAAAGALLWELTITVEDDRLSFLVPAETTEELPNEVQAYVYDIEFTEIATGIVITWIAGNITLTPDVTHDNMGIA